MYIGHSQRFLMPKSSIFFLSFIFSSLCHSSLGKYLLLYSSSLNVLVNILIISFNSEVFSDHVLCEYSINNDYQHVNNQLIVINFAPTSFFSPPTSIG